MKQFTSLAASLLLTALTSSILIIPSAVGSTAKKQFFHVDPAGTYLITEQQPAPNPPTYVSLAEIDPSLKAGDTLVMQRLGGISGTFDGPDNSSFGLSGVFVDVNKKFLRYGPKSNVPDSGTEDDIPEDFFLSHSSGPSLANKYQVQIPIGAVGLYFSPTPAYFYADNIDPDGNFGVRITRFVSGQNDDGTPSCGPCLNSPSSEHPVVIASGLMWHSQRDFYLRGRTPQTGLELSRTYVSSSIVGLGHFGKGWQDNNEMQLFIAQPAENEGSDINWVDSFGSAFLFRRQSDGTYLAPPGVQNRLIEFSDHFEIQFPNSTVAKFSKAPFGLLQSLSEAHGETVNYNYDVSNRLISVVSPMAGEILYNYNDSGLVSSVTRLRDSLTYHYAYDSRSRLTSATDFSGRQYRYTYGETGTSDQIDKLTSITDPLGRVTAYQYDSVGRVIKVTDAGGTYWGYSYGKLSTSLRKPNGQTDKYFFDESGHQLILERPDGSRVISVWADGFLQSTYSEFGFATEYTYDQAGNLATYKTPESHVANRYVYNSKFGKPEQVQSANGSITVNSFDSVTGDLLTESRNGSVISHSYDSFGNVLATNNGRGNYTDERDSNGLLTKVYSALNPESRRYDTRGRLVASSWESGRVVSYSYDDYDNLTSKIDSSGPSISYTYDVVNRLTQKTVGSNGVVQQEHYEYDNYDRIIRRTDSAGNVYTYRFDPLRYRKLPDSIFDPVGNETRFAFDLMDRIVSKVDSLGGVTSYTYDQRGNLTSVTDPSGRILRNYFDRENRKVREDRPAVAGSGTTRSIRNFFYDSDGNLVREVREGSNGIANREFKYSYDANGRLVQKTMGLEGQDSDDESSFSYEDQTDVTLLKTAVNKISSLSFSHLAAPPFSVTSFTVNSTANGNPLNLIEGSFGIALDPSGEVQSVTRDGVTLFNKQYDALGRVLMANSGAFNTSITYDQFGRRSSVAHSDGLHGTFTYDSLNRISSIGWTGTLEVSESLAYDTLGNVTQVAREVGQVNASYDTSGQLLTLSGLYSRSYAFDLLNNRVQDSENGPGLFVGDFLKSNGNTVFSADDGGFGDVVKEVKGNSVKTYTYRADDRLVSYSDGANQVQYFYDALGRRVAKKFSTQNGSYSQAFLHLAQYDEVFIARGGDSTETLFVDGAESDHLFEMKAGVGKGYAYDNIGSVLNTEPGGPSHFFKAYGEGQAAVAYSRTSSPVMFGYVGREFDPESGLNFHRARYYNSSVGRWMSPEPTMVDGPNLYSYVRNNPLSKNDVNGLAEQNPIIDTTNFTDDPSNKKDEYDQAVQDEVTYQKEMEKYSPSPGWGRFRSGVFNCIYSRDYDAAQKNYKKAEADVKRIDANNDRWEKVCRKRVERAIGVCVAYKGNVACDSAAMDLFTMTCAIPSVVIDNVSEAYAGPKPQTPTD